MNDEENLSMERPDLVFKPKDQPVVPEGPKEVPAPKAAVPPDEKELAKQACLALRAAIEAKRLKLARHIADSENAIKYDRKKLEDLEAKLKSLGG